MSLSLAAYQALARQTCTDPFLALVTIDHEDMAAPLYLTFNNEPVVSNGTTFVAWSVDVVLMGTEPGEIPETQIRIDHVDGTILPLIDVLSSPVSVKLEYVLGSDLDTPIVSQSLRMTRFTTDLYTITGTLEGPDFINEPVPAVMMNRTTCPGLFDIVA